MGIQGYHIIAIGMYFQIISSAIGYYGVAMKETMIIPVSNGLAFLVYLAVVLVSTFVFEWGYLGIIWSTTFN